MKSGFGINAWARLAFVTLLSWSVVTSAEAAEPGNAELPAAWKGKDASPAVERVTATRDRMTLDGPWRFVPVTAGESTPTGSWGWAKVPGSWLRNGDLLARGSGPAWDAFGEGRVSPTAWYERKINIPASWKGCAVILDFDRVSTDAVIFINDKEAGTVNWPAGQLDITKLVTPGQPASVKARVVATLDKENIVRLMGNAPGQDFVEKAELKTAGLIGSVTIEARPLAAHVSNVFVRPSFREKKIRLDIELAGVAKPGQVQIVAEMVNAAGKVEKRFTHKSAVVPAERQVVSPSWDWSDPQLWDVGMPNLYTLRLATTGAGLNDAVTDRFGFREFWIDGRYYYLNGSKLRARTALVGGISNGPDATTIDKLVARGFNLGEMWPDNTEERSVPLVGTAAYSVTDEKGFLITGLTPHMGWAGANLDTPGELATYTANAARIMRRDRNHPSIVMWGTSGNMIGGVMDPRYVGIHGESEAARVKLSPFLAKGVGFANAGVEALRGIDPTRPVVIHNGGGTGHVYTVNSYLNFIPLQEREEWMSRYAEKGDMPMWYVEFGTPVALTLLRGRNGFQNAMPSEPFLSEYCAVYLGKVSVQTGARRITGNC
jgi:beta-galactosidase